MHNATKASLYVVNTATCFDISMSSHQSVLRLCLAKLHRLSKLKLLKSQFHKIIKIY